MAWRFAKRRGKPLSAHTPSPRESCSWSRTLFPTIVLPTTREFPDERGFGFTQAAHCSSGKAAWVPCACWMCGPANLALNKLAYSRTWPPWSNASSSRTGRVRPLASWRALAHASWTGPHQGLASYAGPGFPIPRSSGPCARRDPCSLADDDLRFHRQGFIDDLGQSRLLAIGEAFLDLARLCLSSWCLVLVSRLGVSSWCLVLVSRLGSAGLVLSHWLFPV